MNKTFIPFNDYTKKKWYVINAEGKTLGRLSSETANILQGKNKINFYPSTDNGDYVIIINAKGFKVTGKKEEEKLYRRHSGRPGGMKIETLKVLKSRIPERILEKAVQGMLPKTSLGRKMFTRLRVFTESIHPHSAQCK
jgi:large subunit ribosomal protein L13